MSDICFQLDTKVFRTEFTNELYKNASKKSKIHIVLPCELTELLSAQIICCIDCVLKIHIYAELYAFSLREDFSQSKLYGGFVI